MGVATKTYLDAVRDEKELAEGTKEKIMKQEDEFRWFSHIKGGTLTKSLETAFKLFDIVSDGRLVAVGSTDTDRSTQQCKLAAKTRKTSRRLQTRASGWLHDAEPRITRSLDPIDERYRAVSARTGRFMTNLRST